MIRKFVWLSILLVTITYSKEFVFSPAEENAIKTVLRSDGYINKNIYDQFWKDLRRRTNQNDIDSMRKIIPEAQYTQIILWEAVKKSIMLKKPYRSSDVNAVLENMKKKNADQAYSNSVSLLEHAANGTPMEMHGEMQYITSELADFILDNLNGSMKRFEILLANKWGSKYKN